MKSIGRRGFCVALPAFAAFGAGVTPLLRAQVHTSEFPAPAGQQPASPTLPANDKPGPVVSSTAVGTLGTARAIPLDQMPVRAMANGGESRDIAHGTLATGEKVSLHQSMQPVAQTPPALHVIQHSEFICVREGELEFQHEVDGKVIAERAGPGGVFYVAFGTKHAVKNVGNVPAKYFVVAIGGDAK
ncbi:MAG TPA: cupin domain-containing protein [Acidobacteriaceae bacterium]